jgi:hypothetical protein
MGHNERVFRAFCLLPFLAVTLVGCSGNGPKSHSVSGRIELRGGDVANLAGSTLEIVVVSDPKVRGFGEIQPDGRFRLQSLQEGELRGAVPEGQYTARIIPNDEDEASRKRASRAVAPRYLKFETSDLSLQVPASGEVTLVVWAK